MSDIVIVAAITFFGTAIGTFGGILASNKLTLYRLEQLEKKVDKHNNLVERTYQLEKQQAVTDERLSELEGE